MHYGDTENNNIKAIHKTNYAYNDVDPEEYFMFETVYETVPCVSNFDFDFDFMLFI